MQSKLEFSELADWQEFENLVADFFRAKEDFKVEHSGEGSDGGRDILLTFQSTDSIVEFKRKWVVQCKFHEKSISKSHLSDINIPTLIHEYSANGYLLVCRRTVSSKVSEMFENLRKNCKFNYDYEIWTGNELKSRIDLEDDLVRRYFPRYWEFIQSVKPVR